MPSTASTCPRNHSPPLIKWRSQFTFLPHKKEPYHHDSPSYRKRKHKDALFLNFIILINIWLNNIDFSSCSCFLARTFILFKGENSPSVTESPKDPFKHPFKVYWWDPTRRMGKTQRGVLVRPDPVYGWDPLRCMGETLAPVLVKPREAAEILSKMERIWIILSVKAYFRIMTGGWMADCVPLHRKQKVPSSYYQQLNSFKNYGN